LAKQKEVIVSIVKQRRPKNKSEDLPVVLFVSRTLQNRSTCTRISYDSLFEGVMLLALLWIRSWRLQIARWENRGARISFRSLAKTYVKNPKEERSSPKLW
jgi:hypothetical protein